MSLDCDVMASRGPEDKLWRLRLAERKSEQMKLPQALFSYTEKLMRGFLAGHSGPGGEAISKPAQVCVVSENMVHGRGQSLALS